MQCNNVIMILSKCLQKERTSKLSLLDSGSSKEVSSWISQRWSCSLESSHKFGNAYCGSWMRGGERGKWAEFAKIAIMWCFFFFLSNIDLNYRTFVDHWLDLKFILLRSKIYDSKLLTTRKKRIHRTILAMCSTRKKKKSFLCSLLLWFCILLPKFRLDANTLWVFSSLWQNA
jgi:hypothetical protein